MSRFVPAGAPVLHQPAPLVRADQFGSTPLRDVVATLWAAYDEQPAVGVAAPQIGIPLAVAVVGVPPGFVDGLGPALAADREAAAVERQVLVNPSYVPLGPETRCFFEACLSDPDSFAAVERPRSIRVRYAEPDGTVRVVDLTGWVARVVQHEVDHLMGVLYRDRAVPGSIRPKAEYDRARLLTEAEIRASLGR